MEPARPFHIFKPRYSFVSGICHLEHDIEIEKIMEAGGGCRYEFTLVDNESICGSAS